LECAAIHDILLSFEAIDSESNRIGKSNLKRIVSMLTRLIQRTENVSEQSIEYEYEYRDAEYEYRDAEYEYRDAEYEYEKKPEQSDADEGLDQSFLTCVESTPRPR